MAQFRTGRHWFAAPVVLLSTFMFAALVPATTAGAATTTSTGTSAGASPGTSTSSAPGSPTTRSAGAPSISLVAQKPLLSLGTTALVLRVRVANAPAHAAVQVRLHDKTPSSLGFADAIQDDELEPHLDDTPVNYDLSDAPVLSDGSVRLVFPLQQHGDKASARTLKLLDAGVYALDVSLVDCGSCRSLGGLIPLVSCSRPCTPVDSFVTWVVAVSGREPSGVDVAWVWQIASAPQGVDGSLPVETRDAFSERGRLARVTAALDAAGRMPITIAAGGETLTAWHTAAGRDAGTARSFAALKAALTRARPAFVLAPWVPIDERAVRAAAPAGSVRDDLALEAGAVHAAVGVTPERSTAWLDHADARTLAELRSLGAEQVGIRDTELHSVDAALQHQRVSVTGSPIDVLTDDAFLAGLLRGTDAAPLRAQRFVAATALLAYDQPDRRAGAVLATTSEWQPDRNMVAALSRSLQDDPLVHLTTLADAFTDVTRGNDGRGGPLVRDFAPRPAEPFKVSTARIRPTLAALAGFASLVGDDDPGLVKARHSILVAMSTLADRDDAARRLDAIDTTITTFTHSIHASARSVTLTSASGKIPITFTNNTGSKVRLRVRLISDKLDQDGGGADVTLPPAPVNQTIQIPVRVKASGHFIASIEMRSMVGVLPVGTPVRVTVSSRVFGSYGTWLTYGALAFLALWWAHHFLRRRRGTA